MNRLRELDKSKGSEAPKARNVVAWGNARGNRKKRQELWRSDRDVAPSALKTNQSWPFLGPCPRLLHFAPLALDHNWPGFEL